MYHERTAEVVARDRRHTIIAVVAVVLVIVALYLGYGFVRASSREQGATALRQAILDAATRCCAVEGSYPVSLSYLEQKYGLRVNTDDYVVTYEAYAGNVMPSVVVVPR